MELTPKQAYVVAQLPASKQEIAETTTVGPSAIKDRIRSIRSKFDDPDIIKYSPSAGEYRWNGSSELKSNLSTKHKGTITRHANEWLSREEDRLRHELKKLEIPDKPPDPNEGNEDAVLAFSDLHFGDIVEDLNDKEIHNSDLVELYVDHFFDEALKLIQRQRDGGVSFDTLHVLGNGDIITNENIYEGHFEVLDAYLNEQKARAVDTLERNLLKCTGLFDRVQVSLQVGNHGEDRANAASKQANADLHVYRELAGRFATRRDELEDIIKKAPDDVDTSWAQEKLEAYKSFDFNFNNAKKATKVPLRGGKWEGLMTHGQGMYEQISGTAASNDNTKSMMLDREFGFDVAWCGHYHTARKVNVAGRPIIRTPSPKPPDDWAKTVTSAVQAPNTPNRVAVLHGVNDTRPCTFYYEIDVHGVTV